MSTGKFEKIEDGITLFDNDMSPCARRVRMVLIEKGLQWHKVPVDLLAGEQKDPNFLKLNPIGKVPALAVKNVEGVPDCVLYESNVITEFLDSSFPGKRLFPEDMWLKIQAKMWMDWELALVDHFVPFVYQNVMGTMYRLQYSTVDKLLDIFPAETDQQVLDKNIKIYKGQYQSAEEMAIHVYGCIKQYLILERALEGKEHLVGNDFSIADLSVYPRVAMSDNIGMPITEGMFPNICKYKRHLESRACFKNSLPRSSWFMGKVLEHCRPLMVWLGNKRSGIDFTWFDASKCTLSAFDELSRKEFLSVNEPVEDLGEDEIVVFDNPLSIECLQMKLLLEEKGKQYRIVRGDILDLIGCPNGAGGLFMIQHGQDKVVTGYRTVLEYIDAAFPGTRYLPDEPLEKARSQCWQAWEQGMYFNQIWSIFERTIISKYLVKRYGNDIEGLLKLKTDSKYSGVFPSIMRCFLAGMNTTDSKYADIFKIYGHLEGQGRPADLELNTAFNAYRLQLQYLESSLTATDFLVGNDVTLADICVFCRLQLLPVLGMDFEKEDFPKVLAWLNRLKERKSFRDISSTARNFSLL